VKNFHVRIPVDNNGNRVNPPCGIKELKVDLVIPIRFENALSCSAAICQCLPIFENDNSHRFQIRKPSALLTFQKSEMLLISKRIASEFGNVSNIGRPGLNFYNRFFILVAKNF
jgi:hypothetical protein